MQEPTLKVDFTIFKDQDRPSWVHRSSTLDVATEVQVPGISLHFTYIWIFHTTHHSNIWFLEIRDGAWMNPNSVTITVAQSQVAVLQHDFGATVRRDDENLNFSLFSSSHSHPISFTAIEFCYHALKRYQRTAP